MNDRLTREEYLKDPCAASSLPFWKAERLEMPDNVCVFRDDGTGAPACAGERYFKLIHYLSRVPDTPLPAEYELTDADIGELAQHINECYARERVTAEELTACASQGAYDVGLMIAVREKATGVIVASGIGNLDAHIGEGILDWIQVSPGHRRKGFGKFVVCELLRRLSGKASFVTVSGRADDPNDPFSLYIGCGFVHPVMWHVVKK